MRKYLLLSSTAICVLGIPSLAAAAFSSADGSATIANSRHEIGVRLAQANTKDNKNTQPRVNPSNSPCAQALRAGQPISPSRNPNNGFGNCGPDGVPGNSRIDDTNR